MKNITSVAATSGMIETPLGPMVSVVSDDGLLLLEFEDRRMLRTQLAEVERRLRTTIAAGRHPLQDQVQRQVSEYFAGKRRAFDLPLYHPGTPFAVKVWNELKTIPHGTTTSYEAIAARVCTPAASRAVGRANGANRIAIVIPCHRVVGKDGALTGYGGKLWRKRELLALEQRHATPAARTG